MKRRGKVSNGTSISPALWKDRVLRRKVEGSIKESRTCRNGDRQSKERKIEKN